MISFIGIFICYRRHRHNTQRSMKVIKVPKSLKRLSLMTAVSARKYKDFATQTDNIRLVLMMLKKSDSELSICSQFSAPITTATSKKSLESLKFNEKLGSSAISYDSDLNENFEFELDSIRSVDNSIEDFKTAERVESQQIEKPGVISLRSADQHEEENVAMQTPSQSSQHLIEVFKEELSRVENVRIYWTFCGKKMALKP